MIIGPERNRRISITLGGENLQRTSVTVIGVVEDFRDDGRITVLLDPPRRINRDEVRRVIATPDVIIGWGYEDDVDG